MSSWLLRRLLLFQGYGSVRITIDDTLVPKKAAQVLASAATLTRCDRPRSIGHFASDTAGQCCIDSSSVLSASLGAAETVSALSQGQGLPAASRRVQQEDRAGARDDPCLRFMDRQAARNTLSPSTRSRFDHGSYIRRLYSGSHAGSAFAKGGTIGPTFARADWFRSDIRCRDIPPDDYDVRRVTFDD